MAFSRNAHGIFPPLACDTAAPFDCTALIDGSASGTPVIVVCVYEQLENEAPVRIGAELMRMAVLSFRVTTLIYGLIQTQDLTPSEQGVSILY